MKVIFFLIKYFKIHTCLSKFVMTRFNFLNDLIKIQIICTFLLCLSIFICSKILLDFEFILIVILFILLIICFMFIICVILMLFILVIGFDYSLLINLLLFYYLLVFCNFKIIQKV